MKRVTLIVSDVEYRLLCCATLSRTYLADLYALYTGREVLASDHTDSMTTLTVEEEVESPSAWFDCILWSRYRREGEKASLELFVRRPKKSEYYYAVGGDGRVLIGERGGSIKIHADTVKLLCGENKTGCSKPKIYWIDRER